MRWEQQADQMMIQCPFRRQSSWCDTTHSQYSHLLIFNQLEMSKRMLLNLKPSNYRHQRLNSTLILKQESFEERHLLIT
jgi:hypothetical protein